MNKSHILSALIDSLLPQILSGRLQVNNQPEHQHD